MDIKIELGDADENVRANRYDVLSRLADDLAHEIKNPLNAVVVNLEVLRRRVANGAPDAALERIDVIEEEVRRVHALVDQMLQLLRPVKSDRSPPAIDGLIASLEAPLQIQSQAVRVPLRIEYDHSLYAQVRPEPFKFALLNLMTRLLDLASASGGSLALHAQRIADEVHVVVTAERARMASDDEQLRFSRLLTESAGGRLEERDTEAEGSRITMVLPPAKFA